MPNTIVLGLDGANWNLLEPWLDDGTLPNVAALRENGVYADMESCLPPVTCPNWRCYSTAKNPGKLGVFWWEKIDTEERTLSTPTSRSFKSSNFWDYLNDEDIDAGVMNLPMTYPPFEVEEFLVAGGAGSEQKNYTYPPEIGDELDAQGYRLHPDDPVTKKDDRKAAMKMVELIDQRLETFRDMLADNPVAVAHCTIFYINVLQHFFWRGEPTREGWKVIDEHIGAIREGYPDATLMLMSDHGCQDVDTVFYINSWLESEGYLVTTESSASSALSGLGINKKRVSKLAHKFGVHSLVTTLTPEFVKSSVPEDEEGFKREQKLEKVDWERSQAVASGQGLVYVIGDDSVRDELMADIESLTGPAGQSIARAVCTSEEAYDGPHVDEAPDIVFDQRPGVHTSGAIGSNPIFTDAGHWDAENVRTGLYLADGPEVAADPDLDEPLSITQVAPTVLTSVGCPVPEDADGEPVPIFADDREPTFREPIPYEGTDETSDEAVQERLEDLGYLE